MYKSFRIKNFRCFSDFTIKPLEHLNLIAGKNNIGKTALLEALWMHHGYHNPQLGIRVDAFRGLTMIREGEVMINIFNEFDQGKHIILESTNGKNHKATLIISKKETPRSTLPIKLEDYRRKDEKELPANSELTTGESTGIARQEINFEYTSTESEKIASRAYFDKDQLAFEQGKQVIKRLGIFLSSNSLDNPNTIAERFGNLEVNKADDDIIQVLKIIEPGLEKLIVRFAGGIPVIYGDTGKKQMAPLPLMGDGIGKLLRLSLAITDATNGIVLIDEIENGLHHTAIKSIWKAIAKLSRKYNTQVFATTHSRECIQAAYEAFNEDKKYDFFLHRLEIVKGKIASVVYDQEALGAAIKSKFEIR